MAGQGRAGRARIRTISERWADLGSRIGRHPADQTPTSADAAKHPTTTTTYERRRGSTMISAAPQWTSRLRSRGHGVGDTPSRDGFRVHPVDRNETPGHGDSVHPADRHGEPGRADRRNGDQHDADMAARHGHEGETLGEPRITGHLLINGRTRTNGPTFADPVFLRCDVISGIDPALVPILRFVPPLDSCGRHPSP